MTNLKHPSHYGLKDPKRTLRCTKCKGKGIYFGPGRCGGVTCEVCEGIGRIVPPKWPETLWVKILVTCRMCGKDETFQGRAKLDELIEAAIQKDWNLETDLALCKRCQELKPHDACVCETCEDLRFANS